MAFTPVRYSQDPTRDNHNYFTSHPKNWSSFLVEHPDKPLVNFFLASISQGFRIGYYNPQPSLKSARRNSDCTLQHPDHYLEEELAQHRVAGPFSKASIPSAHINRFGVIRKTQQLGKWRLIVDLSHPVSMIVYPKSSLFSILCI